MALAPIEGGRGGDSIRGRVNAREFTFWGKSHAFKTINRINN
jgi:hypothetical protein